MAKRTAILTDPGTRTPKPDVMTVEEFCAALKVSKDTFYHWRKVGTAPACIRLPNGELRIERADRDAWLATLRDVA
ncbi:MAG: helix-turn-helix domain-containing protein [Actinomycetota bacterium]|nr:helix-turn-helix domain-containing protein [Actinomycetota bacterium]